MEKITKIKVLSQGLLTMLLMGCCILTAKATEPELLAFPTAEGYGKYTQGGRGGKVLEVTNLNDAGPGSLRDAVDVQGARTIIFKVSGTIELKSALRIRNPYITIAGQSAPGDGICLKGYPLMIDADQVIVRYIRVRLGDETHTESDAISCRYHNHIIVDHVSTSWSVDETMSIYHCEDVTVQWSMLTESLFASGHMKGPHGFGGIWGGNHCTYHHNLIAHHSSRNPRFCGGACLTDYRNNVIYNWGYNSCYGGGGVEAKRAEEFSFTTINMIANYYKPGPATEPGQVHERIANPSWGGGKFGRWYIADNVMEGSPEVTADNWKGVHPGNGAIVDSIRLNEPWDAMPIQQQTASEAYRSVLQQVGASLHRDAVDLRVVKDVESGTATFEGKSYKTKRKVADMSVKTGIIDSQTDVGGWPELRSSKPDKDTDHDGMPDKWEKAHGLDPKDPTDGNRLDPVGYTMLEVYLNSISD